MVFCDGVPEIISISEFHIITLLRMYTEQESGSVPCVEAKYEQPWLGEGSVLNAVCSKDHIQMNAQLLLGLVLQLA
jgi:hypothetical protein